MFWSDEKYGIHLCTPCINIKNSVTGRLYAENISADMIDPNYKVKVNYDINVESHDGYCSDPSNKTEESSRECIFYPYLKDHPILNTNGNNMVTDLYQGSILLYHEASVGHGNGYCGMQTTYEIVSAKVITV